MSPVKKRALISTVTVATLFAAQMVAGPAAFAAETPESSEATSVSDVAGANPLSALEALGAEEDAAVAAESTQDSPEGAALRSADEGAESSATAQPGVGSETTDAPAGEAGAASTEEEPPAPAKTKVWIDKGFANWNFKDSFRSYVGSEHEETTGLHKIADQTGSNTDRLVWYPKNDQKFDLENPTIVKFGGEVHWQKYGGILNVRLSNPTLDFEKKELRVDAYTKGTLSGGGELTVEQQPLLKFDDLKWENREGYILVYSLAPRITELSNRLVGFYNGEVGSPFVATLETRELGSNKAPDPDLTVLFPEQFPSGKKLLSDPSVPVMDVNIPDENLRYWIRWELDLDDPNTPITNKVMEKLQSVNWATSAKPEKGISSLEGLQHAKNLTSLNLSYHKLTDLSVLAQMPQLKSVNVAHNQVSSLAPLAGLTKLTKVDASYNKLTSLAGLENLSTLEEVVASHNRISDISALPPSAEELSELDLSHNRISDLTPLATELWLREVNLSHNRISSLTGIDKIRGIYNLDVSNNFITDPSALNAWGSRGHLESIRVAHNAFTNWTVLQDAKSKIKDWPEEGQEAAAVNPVSLDDAKAQDARTDAEDPWNQPATPSAPQDTPAEESAPAPAAKALTADLHWGVRESFMRYLGMPFVGGTFDVSEGAQAKAENGDDWNLAQTHKGSFIFPASTGQKLVREGLVSAQFDGKIHFHGHHGLLDLSIASPSIDKTPAGWKLTALVASKPFDPATAFPAARSAFRSAAASTTEAAPPTAARVILADLSEPKVATAGDVTSYTFDSVVLNESGAGAFGGFYKAGDRVMAPLTVNIHPADKVEGEQPNTGDSAGAAPEEPKPNTQPNTGNDKPGEPNTSGDTTGTKPNTSDNTTGTKPSKPVAPGTNTTTQPTVVKELTANLNWGVRSTFRSYVTGKIAQGTITTSEGAYGTFTFPVRPGQTVTRDGLAKIDFVGKVHFKGHHGLLDLSIASPTIAKGANGWYMSAMVASKPFDPKTFHLPAGAGFRSASAPSASRVVLATLSNPTITTVGDVTTYSFSNVQLTEAGAQAFGGFYGAGNRAMDPVSISIKTGKTIISNATSTTGNGKNEPPKDNKNLTNNEDEENADVPQTGDIPESGKEKSSAGNATGNTAATANTAGAQKKQVKECKVDPHKMRLTSGNLSWGVRTSFTSYVRGNIAHGGWDLNGVSWDGSDFNFPLAGGTYNTANGTGTVYYSGSVHFYGHKGILDLTLSNPAIDIEGNSGALYMTVRGSDTSGNKINLGRVHFANISFNGIYATNGSFGFEGASVSLSSTGAQAFAGFYEAGTMLNAMSSDATMIPATECDPTTGDLIEYDAFGENIGKSGSRLASTGADAGTLAALSLSVLVLGAVALRRRQTL